VRPDFAGTDRTCTLHIPVCIAWNRLYVIVWLHFLLLLDIPLTVSFNAIFIYIVLIAFT
jgi:hypothetical protein